MVMALRLGRASRQSISLTSPGDLPVAVETVPRKPATYQSKSLGTTSATPRAPSLKCTGFTEEGSAMELEAAVSYLLALAVPAWLAGEYMVHTWKTSDGSAVERKSEELPAGPAARPAKPARAGGGRLADSRRPA